MGPPAAALASIRLKRAYFGISLTDTHRDESFKWLHSQVWKAFQTEGDPLWQAGLCELLEELEIPACTLNDADDDDDDDDDDNAAKTPRKKATEKKKNPTPAKSPKETGAAGKDKGTAGTGQGTTCTGKGAAGKDNGAAGKGAAGEPPKKKTKKGGKADAGEGTGEKDVAKMSKKELMQYVAEMAGNLNEVSEEDSASGPE